MKNTLNVGRISEGFVLDHIEAGKSMDIYKYLHLDKLDCCVANTPEDKQKNKRERGFYRSRSRYLSQNSMAVYVPHLNITDTILLWSAGYLPPARSPAIASDWSYLLPSESLPDV